MSNTQTNPAKLPKSMMIILALIVIVAVWIGGRLIFPEQFTLFAGTRPDNIGLTSGKLAPCPNSPNCVNSQSQDAVHQIEAIAYNSTPEKAIENLKSIIKSLPRTKIITETTNYIYAEFSTQLMGFVDDVEFYINPEKQQIEIRSASRLGESDLGLNRQRIEIIRGKIMAI